MLNRNIAETEVVPKSTGLPIIKCACGFEILLLPSFKAMSIAIEAHVESHERKIRNPRKAEEESERVRTSLIKGVFDRASIL